MWLRLHDILYVNAVGCINVDVKTTEDQVHDLDISFVAWVQGGKQVVFKYSQHTETASQLL